MTKESLISLHSFCKLIIFSLYMFLAACQQKTDTSSKKIAIIWKDDRATGFSISRSNLRHIPEDSFQTYVEIHLADHGEQPVIPGEYLIQGNQIIFEPLIPFTRGLRYKVLVNHQLYDEVEIPKTGIAPELRGIYPSSDTLPENLLKFYLVFSKPMVEGRSLQFVTLLDQQGDTLPNIFLDLESELWNTERTVLTLWLDPGRIKRDLQPNKLLGPPLVKGRKYKLIVSAEWPDEQGATLMKDYTKNFIATIRDSSLPSPTDWIIKIPRVGTTQAVEVDLREALDYFLLLNTIRVIDSKGSYVNGTSDVSGGEKTFRFTPDVPWSHGVYKLQVDARLEDRAGNNLNRPFDRDLKSSTDSNPGKKVFEKEWSIN